MIELLVKRNGEELLNLFLHDSLIDDRTIEALVTLLKRQMSEQSLAPNMPVTPSKRQFYLRATAPLYILRAAEAFGVRSPLPTPRATSLSLTWTPLTLIGRGV
jgi:hypothetical protein